MARRIEHSLQRRIRLPVGFAAVDWEAVDTVWRLRNTFFYVLTQCRHHALGWDPLLESTNVPDLLGMRTLGAYAGALARQHLPRVAASELLRLLRVPALTSADGPADRVVVATERALALPALQGRGREVRQGRRAALEVLTSHIPLVEAARVLGIARATAYRLLSRPADPALVGAIRLQLGLMAQLEAAGAGA